ncbi:MAG TPA: 6-hydroxymethylpterin diphosphokinase MptE-like protein, partial [bacterium]|nr:6-hydroxymethylpterin diphosphokinase MptE-like protein [bacterium]
LRVIEWPPSSRAFPDQSRGANEAVRRVVQELNGSFVTTVAAGRLWLRNCFSNFLHLDEILDAPRRPQGRPILLAAPGPSLEDAAGVMETVRDRTALWALPSSCPFLMARGLVPDLVVMTDPGFYALHHLQFAAPPCPIVMPLSAARGTWALRPRPPVMLLEQPFLVERTLLAAAGIKAPSVPPHGTVTATALELALAYTSGPVVVAGLDLGSRDLLSHARPNAFDTLLHLEVSRLQPHLAQWFTRDTLSGAAAVSGVHGFRNTPALRTYAGWLDSGFQSARSRLFRLLPSPAELSSMTALDGPAFARLLAPFAPDSAGSPRTPMAGWPAPGARRATAGRLLEQWLHAVMEATGALHG